MGYTITSIFTENIRGYSRDNLNCSSMKSLFSLLLCLALALATYAKTESETGVGVKTSFKTEIVKPDFCFEIEGVTYLAWDVEAPCYNTIDTATKPLDGFTVVGERPPNRYRLGFI